MELRISLGQALGVFWAGVMGWPPPSPAKNTQESLSQAYTEWSIHHQHYIAQLL